VVRLHELLRAAGVYHGAGGERFGEETEKAVVQFQRATHLEADGKVGPMTMIALYGRAAPDRVPQLAGDDATVPPLNVARGAAS
jgi:murein L,D-transpeptidase YcbB/YkuD